MALRISKIDYETKTVTYEDAPNEWGESAGFDKMLLPDGSILRVGMVIEGDGIDEHGRFINPRRVL